MEHVLSEVLVARQPILDPNLEVVGYELLYRDEDGLAPAGTGAAGTRATATVLVDGVIALGREVVSDGEDVFVNLPASMLVDWVLLDLPADGIVLELMADLEDTPEVRAALAEHRDAGFRVALGGLTPGDHRLSLLDAVDLAKVDVLETGEDRAVLFIRELALRGLPIAAEKVEEPAMFDRVVNAGASLVQGFFFTRPRTVRALRPLGLAPNHMALLRAIAKEEVDLDEVDRLIRSDLTLSDRFLRLVDAAAGWRDVESVRHGLVLLGQRRLHRWVTLLVMSSVVSDAPAELLTVASVRARYCEELQIRRVGHGGLEAFALGMFSVLGADGVVPEAILGEVPLTPEARSALLGEAGTLRDLVEICLAAERSDWDELVAKGRGLGLEPRDLAAAHAQALRWSSEVRQSA